MLYVFFVFQQRRLT